MAPSLAGNVLRAYEFISTPLALEILQDLAHGRTPSDRDDDPALAIAAIKLLQSAGAVAATPPAASGTRPPPVQITPQGRVLYSRLAEIEAMATRVHTANG